VDPLVVFGWALVGLIVAVFDKRLHTRGETDTGLAAAISVSGAVAAGLAGQAFGLYRFGQSAGLVCSGAGAAIHLSFYRSHTPAAPTEEREVAAPHPSAPGSIGTRIAAALGWGLLGGFNSAVAGLAGLGLGSTLYTQQYSQFPPAFFLLPLGCIVGFVGGALMRLARPRWTSRQMSTAVLVLSIAYGLLMIGFSKSNARYTPQSAQNADGKIAMRSPRNDPTQISLPTCRATVPAPNSALFG
jgi:hypothetical protein